MPYNNRPAKDPVSTPSPIGSSSTLTIWIVTFAGSTSLRPAAAAGIRSVLALPLVANSQPAALNLYARYPAAFGVIDRSKAALLASLAGLALSVAHSHEDEERRAANLQTALSSRETIGAAMGILMERERITADQSFDVLRRASQHLNLKLREVAQNLIDTGEDPDTGQRHSRDRGDGRSDRRSREGPSQSAE